MNKGQLFNKVPSASHATTNLLNDLSRLGSAVMSNDFNIGQTKPPLLAALSGGRPDDSLI